MVRRHAAAFVGQIATAIVALKGNIYYGLWYPVIVALMTVVIGFLFLKETKDRDISTYQH